MKRLIMGFLSCFAVVLLTVPMAFAQTPDGETPANEGVCDELQGLTPGLYGLCVAFCEAQDHASILDPITEEDLDALENSFPSGRILANYNKRKKAGDPDMPCIKVVEPCPCWSSEELANIEGIMPSGDTSGRLQCRDGLVVVFPNFSDQIIIEGREDFVRVERAFARTICVGDQSQCTTAASNSVNRACQYLNAQGSPTIFRALRVPSTLSFEQYETCQAQVREASASRCTVTFPTQ